MMGFDVAGMLRQADEYLRRSLKSKAVRAAEKRRQDRQSREAEARIRRAALAGGASGAAILGIGVLVAPVAPVAIPVLAVAGGGGLLVAVGSLFRPARRRSGSEGDFSSAELAQLPGDAEDWLLDRRDGLPLDCRPQLDRIFQRLGDLQPHLAALAPHSGQAWEARRLLGDHLPRLILAFEAIPPTVREEDPEVRTRLRTGLGTVADALDELCREVCRDPLMTFEAQGRFLESRYRGEDRRLAPGDGGGQNLPSNRAE